MMMRPRNYSVLNRSIARGITYALRENERKNRNAKRNSNFYLNSNIKQNDNVSSNVIVNTNNIIVWLFIILIVFGLIILPIIYPSILILYCIVYLLIK
jgi:CHASE3 domain sensor protein